MSPSHIRPSTCQLLADATGDYRAALDRELASWPHSHPHMLTANDAVILILSDRAQLARKSSRA